MTLLGASTKRGDDSKIGFFGSGLKYALAVLMREGIDFKIFSGKNEVKVTTEKVNFREKEFDRIFINGEPTSMTTDMGVDWKPWYCVREILCNALDEGHHEIDMVDKPKPKKGHTLFAIEMSSKLSNILEDWQKYFCEKRSDVVLDSDMCQVFFGDAHELIIYRRGIRCHHEKTPSIFHYNMSWAKINESRVLDSQYDFNNKLVRWIATNANEEVVRAICDGWHDKYEGNLDWDIYGMQFSENWLTVIGKRKIVASEVTGYFMQDIEDGALVLPLTLVSALKNFFKDKVHVLGHSDKYGKRHVLPMDNREKSMLDDVLSFLRSSNVDISVPIHKAKFRNEYTEGQADEGQIYVSESVFENGKRYLAMTLIEESMHLKSNAGDGTRTFQNYIISQYLKTLEEKAGVNL